MKPFEPRYKIVRSMKDFDQQHYKETLFASNETSLSFTAILSVNDPKDQLEIFNDFIIKHLEEQTPMKRIRIPRQPASWIRELDIVSDINAIKLTNMTTRRASIRVEMN